MSNNLPINHHYVPRFLLRNFSNDKEMIFLYRFKDQRIVKRNIKYNYSKDNLYKDISEQDIMIVENLFSRLEQYVSEIIKKIIDSKNQVTLNRVEVEAVKRFMYLLEFRSKRRKSQYESNKFDSFTKIILDQNIEDSDYVQLWLNELKTLLTHTVYNMDNDKLSLPIKLDFEYYMNNTFISIWDAYEDERFLISDNFGTFERSRKMSPLKLFLLFPISPRRMIALSNKLFENAKSWTILDSEFSKDIVEFPKNIRVSFHKQSDEDLYRYNIKKLKNKDVIHANELLINEAFEMFSFSDITGVSRSIKSYQNHPAGYVKNKISNFKLDESEELSS